MYKWIDLQPKGEESKPEYHEKKKNFDEFQLFCCLNQTITSVAQILTELFSFSGQISSFPRVPFNTQLNTKVMTEKSSNYK